MTSMKQQSVFSPEQFKSKVKSVTEKELTKQICAYIKKVYPDVYFFTDPSGMYQSSWAAKIQLKANRSKHAQLDLIILAPRNGYHGMIIELKKEGEKVLNKKGEPKTPHLKDQQDSLMLLKKEGYITCFGIGFEQTKLAIDLYLMQ